MARDSAIPPESFEEILAWLDPDREVAATMYVQLRHDLANIFKWRACSDPEGLTDEVFDRVAKKVHEVRPTYVGDPRLYFRAVANNVVRENLKNVKTQGSLDDDELPEPITAKCEEDDMLDMEECLQSCLPKLSPKNRKLIVAYYAKEKQAKIDNRSELAQQLGISVETLRVKVYRIRVSLQECIERCLESKANAK
jgi:RNA polymerase sigma factor (sigma-70 family)